MKIYKVHFHHPHEGRCYSWCGTQAEVKAEKKQLRETMLAGYEDVEIGVEEVDIPTNKPGLLAWLNANFTRDNG